jgi:hypothetical protein
MSAANTQQGRASNAVSIRLARAILFTCFTSTNTDLYRTDTSNAYDQGWLWLSWLAQLCLLALLVQKYKN